MSLQLSNVNGCAAKSFGSRAGCALSLRSYLKVKPSIKRKRKLLMELAKVMSAFTRTESSHHAIGQPRVMDMHRCLWPGCEVSILKSKYSTTAGEQRLQTSWLKEATMPTSVLAALLCHLIHFKFRALKDRASASEAFGKLLLLLCACLDGMNLEHTPFSEDEQDDDANVCALQVDGAGKVVGSQFWDREFWDSYVREQWEHDFNNSEKTWIGVRSGLRTVPLVSLLTFVLDPQHPKSLTQRLLSKTLDVITEVTFRLDESISLLRHDYELHTGDPVKSQLKHKALLRSVFIERVVRKLWSGTDACDYAVTFNNITHTPIIKHKS